MDVCQPILEMIPRTIPKPAQPTSLYRLPGPSRYPLEMAGGKSEFLPQPRDTTQHLDILVPLLRLSLWPGTVLSMKTKSLAWCLLNERADELAGPGVTSDEQTSPGPSKYGALWLRIRTGLSGSKSWQTRVPSEQLHHIAPRGNALNKGILKRVTAVDVLRAIRKTRCAICAASPL